LKIADKLGVHRKLRSSSRRGFSWEDGRKEGKSRITYGELDRNEAGMGGGGKKPKNKKTKENYRQLTSSLLYQCPLRGEKREGRW